MANPYRVGIELAMSSNHQEVLGALSGSLLQVMPRVAQLTEHFNRLGSAITGALGVFVGSELLSGLGHLIDKTKTLSQELTQLKTMGLSAAEVDRLHKEAIRITRAVPGTTELENLKIPGQTYSILGLENSIAIAEDLARYQNVIRNMPGNKGEENEKQLYQMLRSADLIGKLTNPETHQVDIETLKKYLDTGWKVMQGSHGMVTPQTWLNLAQQGGPALMNLNEQGLMSMGMISQMMGGHRAGTAMMSLFGQMAGSQMPKRTAKGMQELGLIGPDEWTSGGGGGAGGGVILSDEARKRLTEKFQGDPLKFAEYLKKQMEDRGITGNEEQIQEIFKIFGRQTTQRLGADMIRNLNQLQQERERLSGAAGVGETATERQKGDVAWNLRAVEAAWTNLQLAISGPNSENVIRMLNALTGAINGITDTVRGMDPKVIAGIGAGIAGLGAALVAAGGLAILAALGPAGWLTAGIAGLGTALATLKATGALDSTANAIDTWFKGLIESRDKFYAAVGEFAANLSIALIAGLQKVIDAVRSWLPSWLGGAAAAGAAPGGANPAANRKMLEDLGVGGGPLGGVAPPTGILSKPGAFQNLPSQTPTDGKPGTNWPGIDQPFMPMNFRPDDGRDRGIENAIRTSAQQSPGRGGGQTVQLSLNIDGRRIAEAISSALADLMTHPTQAPFADTFGGYMPTDGQFAST